MLSTASFPLLAQYHPLYLSDSLPTPATVIHYYTQSVTPCFFFCLFISLSTPPRSLHANLASSFCPRDLKQIPEALFSVLYLQASSKSSRPQSSFLIFVSLAKSSTTCKHVHVGIRMSVHANTHIHINTHTYTLHTHVIKADNETCL